MKNSVPPMAAAKEPTTGNRTGTWRFERPVFAERLAPCSQACPMGEDIPAIMALNSRGDLARAYRKIKDENPFPGVCGKTCFHPCERVCNRSRLDEAVSIRDLEWSAFKLHREPLPLGTISISPRDRRAAVIGSGFTGLSCACFLARLGYQVTLFSDKPVQEQCEPPLVRADVEREIEEILGLGIECERCAPGRALFEEPLLREFQAVYIAPKENTGPSEGTLAPVMHPSGTLVLDEGNEAMASARQVAISRRIVRSLAAGKRAAMLLDSTLENIPLERYARGRLGALSFEAYRLGMEGIPKETIGPEDLDLTRFKKQRRLVPSSPDGFSRAQAVASSKRCFHCGVCTFCMRCYEYCPDLSIRMDAGFAKREIDYDHCKGCGICVEECPRGAIGWVKEESAVTR